MISLNVDGQHGVVKLIDLMGSDKRVLDAARVSTGSISTSDEKDERLIEFLMKNDHHTPFEKIVFEFYVKCPIFVARQWFRHRIGSFNEASARYKEFKWLTYKPERWRKQDTKNKQSSTQEFIEDYEIDTLVNQAFLTAETAYHKMIEKGVAREIARIVMPVALYTEFFWTVNFRSLMNFLKLRLDDGAQAEIRQYAKAILSILNKIESIKWTLSSFKRKLEDNI